MLEKCQTRSCCLSINLRDIGWDLKHYSGTFTQRKGASAGMRSPKAPYLFRKEGNLPFRGAPSKIQSIGLNAFADIRCSVKVVSIINVTLAINSFFFFFTGRRIPSTDTNPPSSGKGFKLRRQPSVTKRSCCWLIL